MVAGKVLAAEAGEDAVISVVGGRRVKGDVVDSKVRGEGVMEVRGEWEITLVFPLWSL